MKKSSMYLGGAILGGAALWAISRKSKAAVGAPSNVREVDGKLQAGVIATGLELGGQATVVMYQKDKRKRIAKAVGVVARERPESDFYLIEKTFLLSMVPEDVVASAELELAWGAVVSVADGAIVDGTQWSTDVSVKGITGDMRRVTNSLY